jgi:polar amino acid transport system substrate-binding protein
VFSLVLALSALAAGGSEVAVFNTYQTPPYLTPKGGLAADLTALLNRRLGKEYRFTLRNVARPKLMREVMANEEFFEGVVLFLNPQFVDDDERKRFLWSPPIFADENVVVFRKAPPPALTAEHLRGMLFGGVSEHRYVGLDALIEKGVVRRENSPDEAASLAKLLAGRVDFVLMNRMQYQTLQRELKPGSALHVVGNPWQAQFTRHLMLGRNNKQLADRLSAVLKDIERDPEWRALLAGYQIVPR